MRTFKEFTITPTQGVGVLKESHEDKEVADLVNKVTKMIADLDKQIFDLRLAMGRMEKAADNVYITDHIQEIKLDILTDLSNTLVKAKRKLPNEVGDLIISFQDYMERKSAK